MDELTRNTDKQCPVCRGLIIEHFSLHSKMVGTPVYGGHNPVERKIAAEFACSQCGIPVRPTEANGLVPFDRQKVLDVMTRAYRITLSRNLAWSEFLPTNGKTAPSESEVLKMTDLMIDHYEESRNSAFTPDPPTPDYLLIIPGKPAEYFSVYKKEEKWPEEAVPARVVKKYDNDFNYISYYIPEDAITKK